MADGGTIFLDEISEMSDKLQTKLLRVLQEREVMRLGDDRLITVDVRVIAATNSDLRKLVKEKLFRADLFYRINVLSLVVPPLRERREDIPFLLEYFLNIFCKKYNKNIKGIEPEGIELFYQYDWPGNTRELQNIMERLVILTDGNYISADLVSESLLISSPDYISVSPSPSSQPENIDEQELTLKTDIDSKTAILKALATAGGNKKKAAQLLGISRTTLWRRLKKYNIL